MIKRYQNKKLQKINYFLIYFSIIFVSSIIVLSLAYKFMPRPFQNIVYKQTILGKFINPIIRKIEYLFVDESKLNVSKYYISIKNKDWGNLENTFALNKRPWFKATLDYNNFKSWPIKVKARGKNYWHWAGIKKSIWLKLTGDKKIDNWKRISFVNIKWSNNIVDFLAYDIGTKLKLLSLDNKFAHLYINKVYKGLFHINRDFDKNYLYWKNKNISNIYFYDVYDYERNDFFDELFWDKRSTIPNIRKDDKSDLKKLLNCVQTNCKTLFTMIDVNKFIKLNIIFELFGSAHLDTFHNHRLYFDNNKNKFEPILWDLANASLNREFDQSYNPISQRLLLSPIFREKKLKIQSSLLENIITENYIESYLRDYLLKYKHDILYDYNMGAYSSITYFDFVSSIDNVKDILFKRRREMLLNSTSIKNVKLYKYSKNIYRLYFKSPHVLTIKNINSSNNITLKINKKRYNYKKFKGHFANHWLKNDSLSFHSSRKKMLENPLILKKYSFIDFISSDKLEIKDLTISYGDHNTTTIYPSNKKEIPNANYAEVIK